MQVMKRIALPGRFFSAVRRCGRKNEMRDVPKHNEGRNFAKKEWAITRVVENVFDRMHRKPSKRFDVGVSVMQGMNVTIQGVVVNHSMSEVKVEIAPEGNDGNPEEGRNVKKWRGSGQNF